MSAWEQKRSAVSATGATSSGTLRFLSCRSSSIRSRRSPVTSCCTATTRWAARVARPRRGGYKGAQYPWESAMTGEEVTPRWVPAPAGHPDGQQQVRVWTGDIELHISSDIAYAVWQYWRVTGDDE